MADQLDIGTSHATLAVHRNGSSGPVPALLCIHGNSFCNKIFKHILAEPLSEGRLVLAFDLPGHGRSSNAADPQRSYNQPAYAQAAVELLDKLGVGDVIVLGWSLGGHIGIEMIPLLGSRLKGLMIVGTPPVGYGELDEGFTFGEEGWKGSFAARDNLTEEEITKFSETCTDLPHEPWMRETIARTDQIARKLMFEGFDRGECLDQRKAVEETKVPIAVVNGEKEIFVNLEFVKNIKYGNLWRKQCIEMEGLLHAPFWAKPEEFGKILGSFVEDCS
jgi:pimeloyl-ACP methyl ester carboxylesterase